MVRVAVFRVLGMTCGSCSASIERLLRSLDVISATVSLLTEEAKIIYNEQEQTLEGLKSSIEGCGFEARLISVNEPKENFAEVKLALGTNKTADTGPMVDAVKQLNGVFETSISPSGTEFTILYDTAKLDNTKLVNIISEAGFDATIVASTVANKQPKEHLCTRLSIKGMTCSACTLAITNALESNEHICKASVSLLTEEAFVEHTLDISPGSIQDIIENTGFECKIIESKANENLLFNSDGLLDEEEEHVSFEIFGINEETDLLGLEYNIEALLNSLPAVVDFKLSFKKRYDTNSHIVLNAQNSSAIRALSSTDNESAYLDGENLIDEVSITYMPSLLGIRLLYNVLNNVSSEVNFVILSSVDPTISQLRLLSRVKEILYWRSNFFKCLLFGTPVFVLNYFSSSTFSVKLMIFPGLFLTTVIQLLLSSYVQFVLGAIFLKKFSFFIRHGAKNASMDVLVCISTLVSFLFSIWSIIFNVVKGLRAPPKVLFDTSCMVIAFVSLGKWLENNAKGSTSTALSKLLSLTPTTCTIVSDDFNYDDYMKRLNENKEDSSITGEIPTKTLGIDMVQTNDVAIVLPGSKIPADGVIVFGETDIDESLMTGESLPVYRNKGDQVIGGTINGSNVIHIKVTRTGKKSQLQQIINLVKDSQVKKAPVQRFADYLAARFVPSVICLSVLTFCLWMLVSHLINPKKLPMAFKSEKNGNTFVCLKLAISVIVVACPCALGLAAPTAVMVGTGVGAENGVFIKGGDILEKARDISLILFDKTGTLTTGLMNIVNVQFNKDIPLSAEQWWSLVGSVELGSTHPIAKTISKVAREKLGLTFEDDVFETAVKNFKVIPGQGVTADVILMSQSEHISVCMGNLKMIGTMYPDLIEKVAPHEKKFLEDSVNSVVHIAVDGKYGGYIELADRLKPHTEEIINYLRFVKHYEIGIVTGDSKGAALEVAKELGIPDCNVYYEVLPTLKDKVVLDLKKKLPGVGIVFVGDGINDAPALVQADIGMAISSGTDIAIDSADIVLIERDSNDSNLMGVILALDLSNETFWRIKMNFIWAMVYNVVMLPFAMGCFMPFNIVLPPAAAAASMALSSVSVVANSLLLKRWRPRKLSDIATSSNDDLENNHLLNLKTCTTTDLEIFKTKRSSSSFLKDRIGRLFSRNYNYEVLPMS